MSQADSTFDALARDLMSAFEAGGTAPWSEARFDDLALRVFGWQWAHNPVYRRFCEGRGATPDTVRSWTEMPAVPTSAFKVLDLAPGPVEATFRTSGTSRGGERRGRHGVRSLALYRASALPTLRAHLAPDGERLRILSLIPSAAAVPESSLARMMAFAEEEIGDGRGGSFARADFSLDLAGFARAAAQAAEEGVAVWVAGTAFAFVHLIDARARGEVPSVALPPGARVMETGGFKGRSREVSKPELYDGIGAALGVGVADIVNEYGMTELLSQFYDGVAGSTDRPAPAERWHRGPPWLRTRVVDPTTLAPVPEGRKGLLLHVDLANLGSVAAVLTEDVGVTRDGAIRVLGRAEGAEPRGCSLTLEELLAVRSPELR
ncbi:LuxE/PaaK family acyltransferase [Gaopeijia maritima]|uniref:Long-chain fatty acid--CoA ligase n=1 Tax=Gaopeijia maritima TaxID=3119007 RepID=A0ABU9E8E7_9BACT